MGMVSSLVGGAGASAAAQAQAKMMAQIADEWHQVGQMQYGWMSPYMNAGTTALTAQMQMLANPINQQAALNDYYSGPQYDQQMQQAQYATNANAEATGGLGNTATGNAIANTSTQLGQQYLHGLTQQRNETFNQLGGLSKQGLSASTSMGNFAHQDMQGRAKVLAGQGAAKAGGIAGATAGATKALGNLGKLGAMAFL